MKNIKWQANRERMADLIESLKHERQYFKEIVKRLDLAIRVLSATPDNRVRNQLLFKRFSLRAARP